MQQMVRPELAPPRTISAPLGTTVTSFSAWIEVTAEVRVSVVEWGVNEKAWLHWAVPTVDGRPRVDRAARYDPLRRAGFPGEPPVAVRAGDATIGEAEAVQLCAALAAGCAPTLLFHPGLGLTSRLDEEAEEFRQRCLAVLVPALRRGLLDAGQVSGAIVKLGDAICSRQLIGEEFEIMRWRVRPAWYPNGVEPAPEGGERSQGTARGWGG